MTPTCPEYRERRTDRRVRLDTGGSSYFPPYFAFHALSNSNAAIGDSASRFVPANARQQFLGRVDEERHLRIVDLAIGPSCLD